MNVGLSLGSNLGDRCAHLQQARDRFRLLSDDHTVLCSPIYETRPVDCPVHSPAFLNAVIQIQYRDAPRQLLDAIREHERRQGRERTDIRNAPRVIDIDILYFGDLVLTEPDLIIPHPRLTTRAFVLLPLADLGPHLIIAGTGRTVRQHLAQLPSSTDGITLFRNDW